MRGRANRLKTGIASVDPCAKLRKVLIDNAKAQHVIYSHALKFKRKSNRRGGGGLVPARANSVLSSPPRIIFFAYVAYSDSVVAHG